MTHLPSLVEFRGLVSEYWYCRIQTMVSPHKHRKFIIIFFIAYCKLTLNYAKAFITLYLLIKSSVSPRVLLGLVLNLLEEYINLWMLYISDKFHYQNQQQKSDISQFTLMYKSFHTSCRLHIVPVRLVPHVVWWQSISYTKNKKILGLHLDMTCIYLCTSKIHKPSSTNIGV